MGTITVSLPSDGETADVSDYNTPVTTIVNEINGGLDNANIASGAAIAGSKLAAGSLTNTQFDTSASPVTRGSELTFDFVASGCVWTADAAGSTRLASMTAGVVYIGGVRVVVSAVTSRTFTASKDVYVDVDNTGTITYTDGTTNAASGALAANSVRLAIIVVGATSIAAAASVNQGQEDRVLPIASSIPYAVTDSLGNLICPRDPNRKLLGYKQRLTDATATTIAQVTGLSAAVLIPTARKVRITVCFESVYNSSSAQVVTVSVWDGTVGSGTQLMSGKAATAAVNQQFPLQVSTVRTLSAGLHTINVGLASTSGTATATCSSTAPGSVTINLD